MSFHAFVDESEPDMADDPGVYLLAAANVEADQLQATKDVVRALLLRGQRKLHWHDEDDGRRMLGVKTIATLPALHLVGIRTSTDETSERRRRLCLCRLLCELDVAGIAQVVLECRQRRQDAADRHLLSALRSAKTVRGGLRMQHEEGRSEQLLWLPDFVAGAAGAARRGNDGYFDQLAGLISTLEA